MFVADVDVAVAVRILADTRRLQQHGLEAAVDAARLGEQRLAVEPVYARPGRRLDRIARLVEAAGGDDNSVFARLALRALCRQRGPGRRDQPND